MKSCGEKRCSSDDKVMNTINHFRAFCECNARGASHLCENLCWCHLLKSVSELISGSRVHYELMWESCSHKEHRRDFSGVGIWNCFNAFQFLLLNKRNKVVNQSDLWFGVKTFLHLSCKANTNKRFSSTGCENNYNLKHKNNHYYMRILTSLQYACE